MEIEMKRCLNELGVGFKHQYPVEDIEHAYMADFYLPLYNIILEVDGSYHKLNTKIDCIRTKEMEKSGYRVLRFITNSFDAQSVWKEI